MELGHRITVDLAGPLTAVLAVLSDRSSLRTFEEELDLPVLGRRAQSVVTTAGVQFSCTGDVWSVFGSWSLEGQGAHRVQARLDVSCRVADDLAREAMDVYRSRSPLPIRTDADAILRRLVEDLFHEKLTADVEAYRRRVDTLLASSVASVQQAAGGTNRRRRSRRAPA